MQLPAAKASSFFLKMVGCIKQKQSFDYKFSESAPAHQEALIHATHHHY
jgi:hypothetical protein